jgi:hypothetical protein
MRLRKLCALVVVAIAFSATPVYAEQSKTSSASLAKAVGCLADQVWAGDDLRDAGLKIGQEVSVRQERGAIPDLSPAIPGTTNLLLLDASGRRAWLFFFKVESDGTFTLVRNAYRVQRSNEGWSASEGNGGVATYRAIASYASKLAKRPSIRLRLNPITEGCRVE